MITTLLTLFLSNLNLFMFVGAFALAAFCARGKAVGMFQIELLRWVIFLSGGIMGLYTFVLHVFFSKIASANIGWAPSPFEYEVGMANLAIGVGCLFVLKAPYAYRVACGIILSVWLAGDAVGHIVQMVKEHNFAPGNAGSWFWTDVLVPLTVCILLWRTRPGGAMGQKNSLAKSAE